MRFDLTAQASRKISEFSINVLTINLLLDQAFSASLSGLEDYSAMDGTLATLDEDIAEFRVSGDDVGLDRPTPV